VAATAVVANAAAPAAAPAAATAAVAVVTCGGDNGGGHKSGGVCVCVPAPPLVPQETGVGSNEWVPRSCHFQNRRQPKLGPRGEAPRM
jgi:hypothetical protein